MIEYISCQGAKYGLAPVTKMIQTNPETAVVKKMLYCPKCQQTYEESSQRFCDNDGGRLLPAPNSPAAPNKSGGVFTNLIGKSPQKQAQDEKLAAIPRFTPNEFAPFGVQKNSDEPEVELELFPADRPENSFKPLPKPAQPPVPKPNQPLARIIKQSEVPSGTAAVGNRQTNPTGRLALTEKNPRVMLGQTIKGRYKIVELLNQDESGIAYLAEDKITLPKKYVVRILIGENADDLTEKIYAEERISLSHVNHPSIVSVIDSGELPEGKKFIVNEFVEAESVKDLIAKNGQFNALRAARIVRQAAYALSEVHQNGILHRNLKPENILLHVNETGVEQVKLTGFGVSDGKPNGGNIVYKSPEVLDGRLATFAGDVYSLAAVAYQMLTNRLPFAGTTEREILKSQREGLLIYPTNLRLDLSKTVDGALEKAMAYKAVERYPKARDFGDAFYNAVENAADWKEAAAVEVEKINLSPVKTETVETPIFKPKMPLEKVKTDSQNEHYLLDADEIEIENGTEKILPITPEISFKPPAAEPENIAPPTKKTEKVQTNNAEDLAWTRRSPEPPPTGTLIWTIISVLGVALLLAAAWGIWSFAVNRQQQIDSTAAAVAPTANVAPTEAVTPPSLAPLSLDTEVPPPPRQIDQPPNTNYFQNGRQSAKGDLIRNFLGFSLYYPNDWQIKEAAQAEKKGYRGKFLDISKNTPNGTMIEQMLVSYYESKGTFKDDEPKFSLLVKEMSETLQKSIPNFQILSQSPTKINGWNAYEVKFQGGGDLPNGEKLILWGRRLFIPAVRAGANSGYEITLLATSQAENVKSVDDVGATDDLSKVLETFEPNQTF